MTPSGMKDHRVRFERRGELGDDGYGNVLQGWSETLARWAAYRPQFGREAVQAGRLESTTLGVLTIYRDAATAGIVASDRVVFVTGPYQGETGQIRSILPTPDGAEIEITVELGVAT